MECPQCKATLHDGAKYCGCGWKGRGPKPSDEPELLIECAHEACQNRAKVKIRVPTGWANLCMAHYDSHFLMKANATCQELGLHTTEQKREWVRGAVDRLVRKWTPVYQREPGADYDEPIQP